MRVRLSANSAQVLRGHLDIEARGLAADHPHHEELAHARHLLHEARAEGWTREKTRGVRDKTQYLLNRTAAVALLTACKLLDHKATSHRGRRIH